MGRDDLWGEMSGAEVTKADMPRADVFQGRHD